MKIKILGTAAGEGMPALWCECPVCAKAAANGGKDIRRRAAYLIDDDTIIDFGPDIFNQALTFGVDMLKIKRVIFTHPHEDHLFPMNLFIRKNGFSQVTKHIDIFGGQMTFGCMAGFFGHWNGVYDMQTDMKFTAHVMWQGRRYESDDMTITPIDANHGEGRNCFVLLIERNGKTIYIGNDTGICLKDNAWDIFKGRKIDIALLDSTMGITWKDNRGGHMGVNVAVEFRDKLLEAGCLAPDAKVFATHFSHNGGALHSDLEEFFAPKGIVVAYDGLEVEC